MPDTTDEKLNPETPKRKKRKAPKTAFKPGVDWTGNAKGRPKGVKNLLLRDFLIALQADFMTNGIQAIVDMREKSPSRYAEMIAKMMPQEHTWDDEQAEGFMGVLKELGKASRSKDE